MCYTCTGSVDVLARAFEDPVELHEAVSQMVDAGYLPADLRGVYECGSPRQVARHVVRCFGSYEVPVGPSPASRGLDRLAFTIGGLS